MGATPGDRLTRPLEVPEAGSYELLGFFTRARDYGIIRLYINGQAVGSLLDGYAPRVEPTGRTSFGRVRLRSGANELMIELMGKDVRSAGYAEDTSSASTAFCFAISTCINGHVALHTGNSDNRLLASRPASASPGKLILQSVH